MTSGAGGFCAGASAKRPRRVPRRQRLFQGGGGGTSRGSQGRVEAIYYTTDLGVPKGFYTPEDIRLEDTADVNDVSLFAGGDVTLTGSAGIRGEDRAYDDWYNPPFNERRRATTSAGIGAGGQIDGVSASNLGTRDFDANISPRLVQNPSEDSRGNGMYLPFDYRSQPDIEYLRDEAIKQEAETGQDNYRQVSGGRQCLRSWPDGSTDRTVVFVENTGDGNNEVFGKCPAPVPTILPREERWW